MKVRTTIQPDREIEVDDAEYRDLQVMGLLVNDSKTTGRDTADADKEQK